ncbi:MAG: hypothetical protein JKY48_09145 [Flavobacteriales bacterium]|nr:hypothetical protein [Flavobacteriales bacterium]
MENKSLKPKNVPSHAYWLGGQGGGGWFAIDNTEQNEKYRVRRYSEIGNLDCDLLFIETESNNVLFDLSKSYRFTFISHCAEVRILQGENTHLFILSKG